MTNNNLQLAQPVTSTPSASEFGIMQSQAESLLKSGFLPSAIKTPEQALAIILTGRELGIPAMAALNTINVIQGKPTISPQLMLALIERSGQLEDIKIIADDTKATVTLKRKGRTAHTETFGRSEAQALGLASRDNYKKQAAVMFKWRAIAACARVVFADVILGLYTPEEMGAVTNEEGEVVETQIAEVVALDPKADLIASAGHYFRQLNKMGASPKWDVPRIKVLLKNLYCTEDIAELSIDDLTNLNEVLEYTGQLCDEDADLNPSEIFFPQA